MKIKKKKNRGAILVMVGAGEYESVEQAKRLVKILERILPEAELKKRCAEKYRIFRRLYPSLKEIWR